jgi:hypothetical protein
MMLSMAKAMIAAVTNRQRLVLAAIVALSGDALPFLLRAARQPPLPSPPVVLSAFVFRPIVPNAKFSGDMHRLFSPLAWRTDPRGNVSASYWR